MLEALCDGKPIRASKDLQGKGLAFRCKDNECESPELSLVIGRGLKIPHFRHLHRGKCSCAEGETDWHLEWKSHFDQIEVDMGVDEMTGERNRADAVVGRVVIEFQHSAIKEEEQQARERFYTGTGGMIWVVDASGKRVTQHFERGLRFMAPFKDQVFKDIHLYIGEVEKVFPAQWFDRPVGVVFDFGAGKDLFYLYPGRQAPDGRKILVELAVGRYFKKDDFIKVVKEHPERFTKTPMKMREDYQWELDRPKREAAERKRKVVLGEQLFVSLARQMVERAKVEQMKLTGTKVSFQLVDQTGYMVDAFGHVHRLTGPNSYKPNDYPTETEFIRWAEQYEAEQAKPKASQEPAK